MAGDEATRRGVRAGHGGSYFWPSAVARHMAGDNKTPRIGAWLGSTFFWPLAVARPILGAVRGGLFFWPLAVVSPIFMACDKKTPRHVRAGHGGRYF